MSSDIFIFLNKHVLNWSIVAVRGMTTGVHMKGKNVVQRRILDVNSFGFFVPCDCHGYNLVLCDAAKSSVQFVTFFGVLQRLLTSFSGSVHRWKILTDYLGLYSVKTAQ